MVSFVIILNEKSTFHVVIHDVSDDIGKRKSILPLSRLKVTRLKGLVTVNRDADDRADSFASLTGSRPAFYVAESPRGKISAPSTASFISRQTRG